MKRSGNDTPSPSTALSRVSVFLRVLDEVKPALRLDVVTGKSILVTTGAATPLLVDDLRELVSHVKRLERLVEAHENAAVEGGWPHE